MGGEMAQKTDGSETVEKNHFHGIKPWGEDAEAFLMERLSAEDYNKLLLLNNLELNEFIAENIALCNPDKVVVLDQSPEAIQFIRDEAVSNGEEIKLAKEGQTIHFDSPLDQARARKDTFILLPEGSSPLGSKFNTKKREDGLEELKEVYKNNHSDEEPGIMKDVMKGKTMYIKFHSLGPVSSAFSIPAVQLTDSAYVAHNENLLYRQGYDDLRRKAEKGFKYPLFKFVHSAGELDERQISIGDIHGVSKVTKNIGKRRVCMDLVDNTVYSMNNQYGGNSIGLKKLAMRLSIYNASKQNWLCEHMALLGVHGPEDRRTYLAVACPSACGKTSTSMLPGELIVGDDIAYLRVIDGIMRAANMEDGMFGISRGVNAIDDPLIYSVLEQPGEAIFSNQLVLPDGSVYWIGKEKEEPEVGVNYQGEWHKGMTHADGTPVTPSHKNGRFTIPLSRLENVDPDRNNARGVKLGGIVYGGRDYDTSMPVKQALGWQHGIVTIGASLESQATFAALEGEGTREFNPMANMDFLSIPLGQYIKDNLEFAKQADEPAQIFGVNYFLKGREPDKDTGKIEYLNSKNDKHVWVKWMDLRVNYSMKDVREKSIALTKLIKNNVFRGIWLKEVATEETGSFVKDLFIEQDANITEAFAGGNVTLEKKAIKLLRFADKLVNKHEGSIGEALTRQVEEASMGLDIALHSPEADAIKTPVGFIPKYDDLKKLFKEVLDEYYSYEDYKKQFTLRVPENIEKIERILKLYRDPGICPEPPPEELFAELEEQKQRLLEAQEKYGDYIPPDKFEEEQAKERAEQEAEEPAGDAKPEAVEEPQEEEAEDVLSGPSAEAQGIEA